MQIQTAESLLLALGDSGLFTPGEVAAFAEELLPLGDDTQVLLRHLVQNDRVPVYQLRKIIHGKAAELFVGPYVIVDKLGEGGMGKVFRARDSRSGQVVALKVVRPHLLSNPIVRGRYEREVQAALAVNHPNIASAYEAGEVEGRWYLAMEFVDGIDLARLVQTYGVLPVSEACEYLRQAALGLQHAHERGFVHRDIKPSNIVVSGERHHADATEPARVKILDMGLVRSVGFEDEPSGPELTRIGTVVGTPDYMAPEQAKNSSTVDHRADLYNLGGTFYFLLTGKPPFPTGSPIEKILKHQCDPPPPLQAKRPDVPDELARIVSRLMAKKPVDRFVTAGDLAEALQPFSTFAAELSWGQLPPGLGAQCLAGETIPPSSQTIFPFHPPSSLDSIPNPPDIVIDPIALAPLPIPTVSATDRTPRPRETPRRKRKKRRPTAPAREPKQSPLPLNLSLSRGTVLTVLLAVFVLVLFVLIVFRR